MVKGLSRALKEYANAFLAFILLTSQLVAPIVMAQPAVAAHGTPVYECVVDTAGPDDEPNQKDLNELCIDDTHLPDSVDVTWNWDDTGTPGNNTMDACALFDTNGNGLVDFAICVVTNDDPATLTATELYNCTADAKPDRCTGPVLEETIAPGDSSANGTECTVTQVADAFGGGRTDDTQAECTLDLDDVVGLNPDLVDVCSYPSGQPNSDPSDCVIIKDNSAFIYLQKVLNPTDDPGLFNLLIDGQIEAANVSHLGNTGYVAVDSDNNGEDFLVSESAGTGTSLADYHSSVQCEIEGVLQPLVDDATQTTINVAAGETAVCSFTNTAVDYPTVTVVKNVVDELGSNASPDSFGLSQNDVAVTSGQTVEYPVGATVAIDEVGLAGYEFESLTGDGCPTTLGGTTVALAEGQDVVCTITNAAQNPELIIEKEINTNDGGNETQDSFAPLVNGSTTISTQTGPQTVGWDTTYTIAPGTYTVTEQEPVISGYTFVNTTCHVTGTQETVTHPVALNYGDSVTCVINNDDIAPSITLVKDISGFQYNSLATAEEFVLHLDGIGQDGTVDRSTGYETDVVANSPYTLSEELSDAQAIGHELDRIECRNDVTDAIIPLNENNQVTLDEGVDATCTFYNVDLPAKVIVKKILLDDNADGGTLTVDDFPISFNDELVVMSGGTTGEIEVAAGEYDITEGATDGYTFVDLGDGSSDACVLVGTDENGITTATVTVEVGVTYTCIFVNDDIAPTLTLRKEVINTNGGLSAPENWTLIAEDADSTLISEPGTPDGGSNPPTATTQTYDAVAGITYYLSEDGPLGYEAGDWTCDGGVLSGNEITLSLDEDVLCTITNSDLTPTLTLVKKVVNDDGGDNAAADWTLSAEGISMYINEPGTSSANPLVATTNTYNIPANEDIWLSEDGPDGYTDSEWSCDVDGVLQGHVLNVPLDTDVTCEITNDDIAPVLWVQKNAINDNGGTMHANQFNMYVNGGDPLTSPVSGGTIPGVSSATYNYGEIMANTPYTLSEDAEDGYTEGPVQCYDFFTQAPLAHPLSIDSGKTAICTITNNDQAASLTLVKEVKNDDGGDNTATEWTLKAVSAADGTVLDEPGTDSGNDTATTQTVSVTANSDITLSEYDGPGGYTAGDWECDGGDLDGSIVQLANGEDVTCTIVNDDKPVDVNVTKYVTNDDGGLTLAQEFVIRYNGNPMTVESTSGTVENSVADQVDVQLAANTIHTITEDIAAHPGYENAKIECSVNQGEPVEGATFTADSGDAVQCDVYNDDLAPTITLIKEVENDNGGLAEAADWTLYALSESGDLEFESGDTHAAVANSQYALDELLSNPEFAGQYDLESVSCDTEDVTALDQSFTLDLNQDLVCTITNNDIPPEVTVIKYAHTYADFDTDFDFQYENNEDDAVDFTIDDFDSPSMGYYEGSYDLPDTLQAGTLDVTETVPEGWFLDYTMCQDINEIPEIIRANDVPVRNDNPVSVEILPGDKIVCVFYNIEGGDIIVHKVHDVEEDRYLEEDEPLEGWEFNLYHQSETPVATEVTGEDGVATFNDVMPSGFWLEENLEAQPDWNFSNAYCDGNFYDISEVIAVPRPIQIELPGGTFVNVMPGLETECWFGNFHDPILELEKFNNTGGESQSPGDSVEFTLVVTNPAEDSGVLYDTVVTDQLQPGFSFDGVVSIISSVRGDITAMVGDPGYTGNTGVYNLGDMVVGEVVTIVYSSTIGEDVVDGVYPDVAFAQALQGCSVSPVYPTAELSPAFEEIPYPVCEQEVIFSNVHLEGYEENPFVGTEVSVVTPPSEEVGFVLGVTTVEELVNTGVPAILPAAVGAIITLISLALAGGKSNRARRSWFSSFGMGMKGLLIGLLALAGLALSPQSASALSASSFCAVTMSMPASIVTQETINVDYQVSSTGSADTFAVGLYVDGALEQSIATVPNHGNGSFDFTFPAEGAYDITVEATNSNCLNDPNANTPTVSVIYDATQPSVPVYEGVERNGNTYTVSFTAPNSADVKTIAVYASTSEAFDLTAANKVGEVAVTPGADETFVYTAPDSQQRYFAVVAVDAAGNQSPATGDSRIEVVTTFVNTPTTATGGAVASGTDGASEDGSVLGDEDNTATDGTTDATNDETTDDSEESDDSSSNAAWLLVAGGAALVGIWYIVRQRTSA